ncbi:DEAD/DEAH box helicase [Nocardioides sp. TRM66260-LWL]|uniref:UvrD-helicase domain-containing protein n=1 Tax=Nocardioides sp. TRM66260-LWL TaxID=2874478 RepID=UPI001CC80358|nr:UvrD-helicase domain-containing protein [Nocardioides sp. TRM66260-LWL]MBZ5734168.1 DEAD/DEAH box helicase [Nocardioides sp. TRM66260-LWL]
MITPRTIGTPAELQAVMGSEHPPSDQQWAAISAPLAPAVVIAGAGSGKTTLMAARVVYLVVTGQVRPEEILGLTFTTKAAAELRQRVRAALVRSGVLPDAAAAAGPFGPARAPLDGAEGAEVLEPSVLTYNAYAAQLLADHGLRLGHEPDTRVITDAARYQLGARVVERHTEAVEHLTDHPPTAIQNLLALDGAMSEHLVAPAQVRALDDDARAGFVRALEAERAGKDRKGHREACEKAISAIDRRRELLGLVAGYRRLKRDLGLMDFSDQIELAARLAVEHPDVGAAERARYRVVLLDEYQDTSVAQATLLSRLFSGPEPAAGRGHAVMAVGDPNQAIYGWRGASVSNIVGFGATFPAAVGEVPVHRLTVNRRSDARILEVANRLAAPLLERYPLVAPLDPKPGAEPGTVETHVFETAAEELEWLTEQVLATHEAGQRWADVGVLVRDNGHAAEVFDALSAAGVPVEIVGLSGLLRLPEVAEIVATLHLLHDVTANAALLTLLAGPRWAIGPRDLRLLRQRAEQLAGRSGRPGADEAPLPVGEQLLALTDDLDPAEVAALDDALHDPGDLDFSAEARERFALLAAELRTLRRHVGEPLLDVVRRIVDVTGVDVELASAVSPAAAARRDNLDLFVRAVADFQAVDGAVTLPALLAYLTAEDDQGNGLDLATPTLADSVKLLTVHRSKGLEWPTVFVVGVCHDRFPNTTSRTLWTSSPAVLPAPLRGDAHDQPQLAGHDKAALDAYRAAARAHDAEEELRLGYVAFTRAAHRLAVTGYCWGPRQRPFGPSPFQVVVRDHLESLGEPVDRWRERPDAKDPHPYAAVDPSRPWPLPGIGREAELRRAAAARVQDLLAAGAADAAVDLEAEHDDGLDLTQVALVSEWDAELERLLAELRRDTGDVVEVDVPSSLSATALLRLADDAEGFVRELARPMPRPPSGAARFGTRFHAWVEERFGQQGLFPDDEVPGRADRGVDDDPESAELAELIARFEAGPFGERVPLRVEAPFAVVLAGQVVRGRLDAVYAEPAAADGSPRYLVVDWKTSRSVSADPLQLALYRVAWAELAGVPLEAVRAAFFYVRTGVLDAPDDLPGRDGLEALVRRSTVAP